MEENKEFKIVHITWLGNNERSFFDIGAKYIKIYRDNSIEVSFNEYSHYYMQIGDYLVKDSNGIRFVKAGED